MSPENCSHPAPDVVLVEEGSECTRCGLVAQVMPAPTPEYLRTVGGQERNIEHIHQLRAMLAEKREAKKVRR